MKARSRVDSATVVAEPSVQRSKRDNRASVNSQPSQNAEHKTPGTLLDQALDGLISFFASLRLTVVLLALGIILVFWGTLAQVDLGLFKAQNEFFRSFFVYWGPKGASWKIPVFPAGYLVGGLLLINLVTAHVKKFKFTRKKAGIWLVHFGIILLLLGQLLTDVLSRESSLHLREGEAKNYSEIERDAELAVVDVTDPNSDKVVAIPQSVLMHRKEIEHSEMPFKIRVKDYFANSFVDNRPADTLEPPASTQGIGARAVVREVPRVTQMERRDVPSAVIELIGPQGSMGSWLVSEYIDPVQSFTFNNRTYELALRPRRIYKPYSIALQKFSHDVYAGTDTPKNFSSRVTLQRPDTGENREVLIYMNNPLRYAGETYYQASFDEDDHGSILQVVHNPGWLTPYFSCILVAIGLLVQFGMHLFSFANKRRKA
jgi:hypothetical protein